MPNESRAIVNGDNNIVIQDVAGSVNVSVNGGPTTPLPLRPVGDDEALAQFGLKPTPSQLLEAQSRLTPLVGRAKELEELIDWARSEDALGASLIVGEGGSGKTRLAIELLKAIGQDCVAGFLRADFELDQLDALANLPCRRVIVVDYAEVRPNILEGLIERLAQTLKPANPVRLLILVRHDESVRWGRYSEQLLAMAGEPLDLSSTQLDGTARHELFTLASLAVAQATGVPGVEDQAPQLNVAAFNSPLMVLIAAFLAHSGDAIGADPVQMLDSVLRHEERYWADHLKDGITVEQLGRAVAAWTLSPIPSNPTAAGARETGIETLKRVVSDLNEASTEHAARFIDTGRALYPPASDERYIRPLQPDKLGERLIARCVDALNLEAAIYRPDAPVADVLAVSTRTAFDYPGFASVYRDTVSGDRFSALVQSAIEEAEATTVEQLFTRVTIARTLGQAVPLLTPSPEALMDAGDAIPGRPDLITGELHLDILQNLVDSLQAMAEANPAAYLPDLAASLNNVSNRLGELGRRDEALEAITEAVDIRRRLAEANPAAYLPDLAMSLNNVSVRLGELGRRDEALEASTEAVDIYRRLAEANPAAYLPNLAASLNNVSVRLGELGRRDEALEAITEAVDIRRRLAEANPAAYLPNLATSLNNVSVDLGELGRRDEALEASTEAVDIYRRLAEANPAAYLPNLAASLNNVSVRLGELGRRDEALEAITEAVDIYRRLAEANPAAYLPDLAMSLNNVSNRLGELGRRDEALEAITEAVDIYRRLAEANPAAYLPDLAMSLNNVSNRLGELGRRDEALEASTEAVDIYRRLAEANPAAYLPDLAMSLNNVSVRLGELGRRDEAFEAITEAVDIRRRLAEANPAAYLPDLASSLNNVSVRLGELGRRDEAFEAITEAVDIRRRLAEANPAAYLPDLASSLNNVSNRLGELGRRDEALEAITEAVDIRRRLAEANPAAYLPDLASSLNNVSNRLGELGRRDEALEAITEAVDIRRRLAEANPAAYGRQYLQSLRNLADHLEAAEQVDEAQSLRQQIEEALAQNE